MSVIATIIDDYQALIAGFVGFTGVIITLLVNAKNGREQIRATALRESNAIRRGLIAELGLLQLSYIEQIQKEIKGDGASLFLERVFDDFYRAMLPQLGKLSPDEITTVVKTYQLINEMPTELLKLSSAAHNEQPTRGLISIDSKHLESVKKLHQSSLKEIDKAVNVLDEMLVRNSQQA